MQEETQPKPQTRTRHSSRPMKGDGPPASIRVKRDELSRSGDTYELEGYRHGNTPISLILVDLPPGEGPKLHTHPYEEVFVIQQGCATYTVGSTTLEAKAGQIVIVPAGVPHKFINSGSGRLVQVDIHHSPRFITQWLEE